MNYTIKELNNYIETEKRKCIVSNDNFQTIALDGFVTIPTHELWASLVAYKHVDVPHKSSRVSLYRDFMSKYESGVIDIILLTSREKLMLLTCLLDTECQKRMMEKAIENRENHSKLRKMLPKILPLLKDDSSYTLEQIDIAQKVAQWYVECNQRLLHYRRYMDLLEIVWGRKLSLDVL